MEQYILDLLRYTHPQRLVKDTQIILKSKNFYKLVVTDMKYNPYQLLSVGWTDEFLETAGQAVWVTPDQTLQSLSDTEELIFFKICSKKGAFQKPFFYSNELVDIKGFTYLDEANRWSNLQRFEQISDKELKEYIINLKQLV